jgi:hypothetical protein
MSSKNRSLGEYRLDGGRLLLNGEPIAVQPTTIWAAVRRYREESGALPMPGAPLPRELVELILRMERTVSLNLLHRLIAA